MSARGVYGSNGVSRVGQVPARYSTVYVERTRSSLPWIVGALGIGASLLWARHQSRQIEQLYKASGIPYKSFTTDLREGARSLTSRFKSRPAAVPSAKGEV